MRARVDLVIGVQLHEPERFPEEFLTVKARDLYAILPGPTLVHLPGRREPALFVSILLHGNEDVGLLAVQNILKRYAGRTLPRALSVFVGNVAAARSGLRRREGEPDNNRVWPGTATPDCDETRMMRSVVTRMRERGVFASVDLHNNTGLNPHCACVTVSDAASLQLARLFSRTAVYFRAPAGVQAAAFAALAPAITCECGQIGDLAGTEQATSLLDACLHLDALPRHAVASGDLHLFHTVAIVKPRADASLSFDGNAADLMFVPDLDHFNFRELPAGAALARCSSADALRATAEGRDVTEQYFGLSEGMLTLKLACIPAMLTRDQRAIQQDCLCYLMERMPLPQRV
ncbi:MAG: M14 family metallopeptidase [Steroidobacteraceae bacterium]